MQLLLTFEELQLTVNLLEQRNAGLRDEIVKTDRNEFKHRLQNEQLFLDELENKLIRKELGLSSDELDFLASELGKCDRALVAECVRTNQREFKKSLAEEEAMLQRVRDKVTEACAMA